MIASSPNCWESASPWSAVTVHCLSKNLRYGGIASLDIVRWPWYWVPIGPHVDSVALPPWERRVFEKFVRLKPVWPVQAIWLGVQPWRVFEPHVPWYLGIERERKKKTQLGSNQPILCNVGILTFDFFECALSLISDFSPLFNQLSDEDASYRHGFIIRGDTFFIFFLTWRLLMPSNINIKDNEDDSGGDSDEEEMFH